MGRRFWIFIGLCVLIALVLLGALGSQLSATRITTATNTLTYVATTETATHVATPITTERRTTVNCDPSYPDICIPPPPPKLSCREIREIYGYSNFKVLEPDPHGLDRDRDGIGCEE